MNGPRRKLCERNPDLIILGSFAVLDQGLVEGTRWNNAFTMHHRQMNTYEAVLLSQ